MIPDPRRAQYATEKLWKAGPSSTWWERRLRVAGLRRVAAGPACGPVAHVDGQAEVVPAGEEFQAWQFRFPLGAE